MFEENNELLTRLSQLFLNEIDPDEAYFKIVDIIDRLNDKGIYINIREVQRIAYKYEEVVK